MYCAVRECVIVGMNQIEYEENEGLLWHPEVKLWNSIFLYAFINCWCILKHIQCNEINANKYVGSFIATWKNAFYWSDN